MTPGAPSFQAATPPWVIPAAPPPAVAEPRPGGFWRRTFAVVVDAAVVWALLLVGDLGTAALGRWDLIARAFGQTWSLVIPAAYFVLLHGSGGRTLGKMLAGVRVVLASGEPLGYARALVRYVAWLLLLFAFLVVAVRGDKRGLHDLLAGTRVVRAR
jgi:uncharacterized RDD family membrane protein YckC